MKKEIKKSIEKLKDKNFHFFNVDIAAELGIEKAILLQNFQFWLERNKANETHIHARANGKIYYWTYNSRNAFSSLFPYLKERTIGRYLQELEDDGILLSDNFNIKKYDRTKWYTIPHLYETQWPKTVNPLAKMTNGCTENGQPIPDINSDKKPSMHSAECGGFSSSSKEKKKSKKEDDWDLNQYLTTMSHDFRHIQIIGLWVRERNLRPESKEQMQSIIKRNVRAAMSLIAYSDKDIKNTIKLLENDIDYINKFSLVTVGKYIDEEVTQGKKPEKEVVRYEKNYDDHGDVESISPVYKEVKD